MEVEKTEQLSEMRADFAAKAKQVERDARKRAAKEKKLKEETNALLDAVKRKGIEVMYSVRRKFIQRTCINLLHRSMEGSLWRHWSLCILPLCRGG